MKQRPVIMGLASALVLAGCGMSSGVSNRSASPTPSWSETTAPPRTAAPFPQTAVRLQVQIQPEPNDYAHRNYCAEGAIAVLLSTWTTAVPSIDAIGEAAQVMEAHGTKGANQVKAINAYLELITGRPDYAYSKTYVTSLATFHALLETDLSGLGRFASAGHGSPVLVHVMTTTLPGWDGYRAGHVVAVFGYDFSAGNPAVDTVTYAETAGSVAGYNGPRVQTISLAELWTAMHTAPPTTSSRDPWTVIA